MGVPRMIQTTFGATTYSTGVLAAGAISQPGTATVAFNETLNNYLSVKRHNDEFYIPNKVAAPTKALTTDGLHFATYDYIDLRDLLEEKACMDDVVINVQRLRELPYPALTYNMAPGNIEETLLVILGDMEMETIDTTSLIDMHDAGFKPIFVGAAENQNKGGLPFEVLYRETRQYVQDPSQNFLSPDQMGSFAGPGGDSREAPSRFIGNFRMTSRTIGGYPDLLVGPGITVVRAFSIYPANRTAQTIDGGATGAGADAPADEFTHLSMQLQCQFPALQYNIVGTQRKLTATETATYYSNILMKS